MEKVSNAKAEFKWLGLMPYAELLHFQEDLFHKNILAKENGKPTTNTILLCEHTHVYTLGKSGKRENILVSDADLHADFFHVNRGGDVTYHGPGQLVVYPIVDLDSLGIGLAHYIFLLEQTVIDVLEKYQLKTIRIENAAGIWLNANTSKNLPDRKICAIGVKASRGITMHGIAINITTDLSRFDAIVPCGLKGKGVTSLEKELGSIPDAEKFRNAFTASFEKNFGIL